MKKKAKTKRSSKFLLQEFVHYDFHMQLSQMLYQWNPDTSEVSASMHALPEPVPYDTVLLMDHFVGYSKSKKKKK